MMSGDPRRARIAVGLAILALPAFATCGAMLPPPSTTATLEAAKAGPGPAPAVVQPRLVRDVALEDLERTFWKNRQDLFTPPPPAEPRELPLPRVERWKLANGLLVIVVPRGDAPVATYDLAVRSGSYDEGPQELGVAELTASMLRKGTTGRTADEITDALDRVSAELDEDAFGEYSHLSCGSMVKDQGTCLDLLAELAQRPTFPEDELALLRDRFKAGIARRAENPTLLAQAHFNNLVFGEQHPDGRLSTAEDIDGIRREQLVRFWRTFYRPNNSLLVVSGATGGMALRNEIGRRFGEWAPGPVPVRPEFHALERKGARFLLVDRDDLPQAVVMLGHRGPSHRDPDWYAASVLGQVLGGAAADARLSAEVRGKQGLAFAIASSFGAALDDGAFRVTAVTRPDLAWSCLMSAVEELRKIKATGVTDAEVARARGFFAASYPFRMQTSQSMTTGVIEAELHGLGIAYVKQLPMRLARVDAAHVKRAAEAFLQPENLVVVIVGKGDVIAPTLEKNGMKFERIHYREPASYLLRARMRQSAGVPGVAGKAREILAAALEAQGGARLRALKDVVIVKTGERHQAGTITDLTGTTYYRRPDRMRVEQELVVQTGKSRVVFIVGPGGIKGGRVGAPLQPVPPDAEKRLRAAAFEDANFIVLNILDANPPIPMQVLPPIEERGSTFQVVRLRLPSGDWTRLYFDARTKLLASIRSTGEDGVEQMEVLEDYRDVGGLKFAFRQMSEGSTTTSATVKELKVNPPLDAALFE